MDGNPRNALPGTAWPRSYGPGTTRMPARCCPPGRAGPSGPLSQCTAFRSLCAPVALGSLEDRVAWVKCMTLCKGAKSPLIDESAAPVSVPSALYPRMPRETCPRR